jgi:hypothetical protein
VHATQPKYQYRHRWLDGDIVIWDDRCTMHKANPDIPVGEKRTCIGSCWPMPRERASWEGPDEVVSSLDSR